MSVAAEELQDYVIMQEMIQEAKNVSNILIIWVRI